MDWPTVFCRVKLRVIAASIVRSVTRRIELTWTPHPIQKLSAGNDCLVLKLTCWREYPGVLALAMLCAIVSSASWLAERRYAGVEIEHACGILRGMAYQQSLWTRLPNGFACICPVAVYVVGVALPPVRFTRIA